MNKEFLLKDLVVQKLREKKAREEKEANPKNTKEVKPRKGQRKSADFSLSLMVLLFISLLATLHFNDFFDMIIYIPLLVFTFIFLRKGDLKISKN